MASRPIRWTVAPAHAARFTPAVLDAVVARTIIAAEDVKRELAGRRVSRLCLTLPDSPDIYLKEYSIPLAKPFRALVRPYGFDEWRTAQVLQQKGIPTVLPVAIGAVRRCGLYRKVYFMTEAIPDSMTLKEYIDRYGPRGKNNIFQPDRDLIDHFAAFAAMLRTAGVVHRDLHWGNILISTSIEDAPRFYLIDLHQVRVRTVPHDRAGLSNLALLSAALWGNVPSRAQIHFLKAYCRNLLLTRDSFLQVRDAVQGRRDRLLRRKWETLVARSLRENKYFKKIRCGRYSGLARRDCPEAVRRLMEDPDRLFACPDAQVLKDSRTTSSLILHCSEPGPLFFKRYNRKSAWQVLRHLFKRSRARKVWIAAHAMAARGLPTPRPLLYCEERTFGLVTRSFIVTQAIAPATTLEGFAAGRFTGLDRSEKHALIRALARRLRELHDRGVRHGDLKAKNIILADAGSAPHRRIYFVDLDGVRITTSLSLHDRCRDIARLNRAFPGSGPVSTSHRLLFLKAYLGAVRREELRTAWQGIVRLTGKNGKAGVPART